MTGNTVPLAFHEIFLREFSIFPEDDTVDEISLLISFPVILSRHRYGVAADADWVLALCVSHLRIPHDTP